MTCAISHNEQVKILDVARRLASIACRSSQLVRGRGTSARTARSKATRGAEEKRTLFSSSALRVALFLAARALVSRSLTN